MFDPDNGDDEIAWSWSGNSELQVRYDPIQRRIRIRQPGRTWTGGETILLTATDPSGASDSDEATFTVLSPGDETGNSRPVLLGNHPNPFNPSTTIHYRLDQPTEVTLTVFSVLGDRVITLVEGMRDAGLHSVLWHGNNADGAAVASGLYFYRLSSDRGIVTHSMLLMK